MSYEGGVMCYGVKTHKDLNVWKEAIRLAKQIYLITRKLPDDEKYGMSSQLKRSAISIPSNIAEGAGRNSIKEYIKFLYVSLGSLSELETQLILSYELGLITDITANQNVELVRKMLLGLIKALKSKTHNP